MENVILSPISLDKLQELIQSAVKDCLKSNAELKQTANLNEELLTQQQALKFLGITLPTLHRWESKNYIKSHRVARRVYYRRSELLESLAKNRM